METSLLICPANQLTGFHMMGTLVVKRLILKLLGAAFIRGQRLKERDVYFKIRGSIHVKFQIFVIFPFQVVINNYHCDI